ncbi:hypothetical protein KUTeg_018581 [Tegillarca granosa]|uniref:Splicing factor Cactin n=1 Tax=Tegillarca granosa TaxID=220873 RepID=A0ABQ9EI97_TEGGR|nr:hypothetical protein KUTeg_018581 [Tegillarca granosa]
MGKKKKRRDRSSSRNRSPDRSNSHKRKKSKKSSHHEDSDSDSDRRSRSPHRHRHKKRRTSSSSSDSDDSSKRSSFASKFEDMERHKLENIEKLKEERRQQKELIKSMETAEEKRARRLAKKELKERKRKEKMGWDKDYLGYTNADNPFGDEHLLDHFKELEKVKKRRLERERELEEREKERERLQRDKEVEYFREWEKQEDTKPIDLLGKYISAEDDDLAIEMHEPYTYLYGLTITDLEDLLEDIKVYLELEEGKNADYWRDIITVTNDELNKLRKLDTTQREFRDRREGINESVSHEVASIFKGKTTSQLLLLEEQIKKKLKGGEGVDVGYWESLLQQLKAHMARTRLRERHQEQGIESDPLFPAGVYKEDTEQEQEEVKQETPGPEEDSEPQAGTSAEDDSGEAVITEEDIEDQAYVDYEAGGYSPKLLRTTDLDIDAVIYDPVDDMKKLELARLQVKTSGRVRLDGETEFEKKAREGMNDDEATFSGFEWNKYNQTHYDIDNPPPKIVQGYKFNTPIEDNKDFAILRFKAGPPYEDIAFKISTFCPFADKLLYFK